MPSGTCLSPVLKIHHLKGHPMHKCLLRITTAIFFGSLLTLNAYAEPIVVKSQAVGNDNDRYSFEMLKLALSYSNGKYTLTSDTANDKTLARTMTEIESGEVNVMWTATDKEKEDRMLPIRIPLYKGLFGYRLLMINKDNQSKFTNIQTLNDLKQVTLGQGTSWADTKILEENGLKVVKTMKYPSLIYMVDGGRFDAFPRGVHEPWAEIKNYPKLNLMVEPHVMLVYKMPFYLFVSKNNESLARDIEQGFNLAIADGNFNKHFYANPAVQEVIANAN
ncbi:MAG: transporter substrate-binding domain-containing protein, partial [Moraxellaceae bacterium]